MKKRISLLLALVLMLPNGAMPVRAEETEPVVTETAEVTQPVIEKTETTEETTEIVEEAVSVESIVEEVSEEPAAASVVASGICGEDMTWLLEDGTLTISGTGDMFQFPYTEAPWHTHEDQIEYIHVENGVESISEYAFALLGNLRGVMLPLSITSIGRGAFLPGYVYVGFEYEGCEHQWANIDGHDDVLEEGDLYCRENENEWDEDHTTEFSCSVCGLEIEPVIPHDYEYGICTICGYEDPDYTIVDFGDCGDNLTWTFEEDGTLTISGTGDMTDNPWWRYRESITTVILEQGLTSIADGAFEECYQLAELSIPDSVITIGDYAFACCYSLNDISISAKVTYIGEGAFLECTSIESILLPVGITEITECLFVGCTKLNNIQLPANIVSIGDSAFAYCEKLNSITIPEGVVSIGAGAFEESGLRTVSLPKSIESIGTDEFYPENIFYAGNEGDRKQIILDPYDYFVTDSNWHYNSTEPHSFTEIDTMDIEPTCTEVGFYDGTHCSVCNSVLCTQYEIPALGHDYRLKVTPPSCTEEGYTTYSCSRCSDNYLDNYTEAAGHTEEVDEEVLPSCVETGLTEGYHCSVCNETLLEQEIIPAFGHLFEDYIFNEDATCTKDGTMTAACAYGCGATDTQVAEGSALGHVEAWDEGYEPTCTDTGLTEGYHCSVCSEVLLTQEVIPALGHDWSVWIDTEPDCVNPGTEIHSCYNCGEERQKVIPALGHDYEMDFCTVCGEIDPSIFPITGKSSRYVSWKLDSEGVLTFTGTGDMETVNWSRYAEYVKTVVIAEGITSIAYDAFYGYRNIADITLPNSLRTIAGYAFAGCSSLVSITIPSDVTEIKYSTFSGCTSLKDVQLPDSITEIGSYAFSHCESLKEIIIPRSVTKIDSHAFSNSGLRRIVIPNTTCYIGSSAFANCEDLQEVGFLEGNTNSLSIGAYCFESCKRIKEISLPLRTAEIGNNAFVECTSLNDVYYQGTEKDREEIVIGNNNSWLTGAVWHYVASPLDIDRNGRIDQDDAIYLIWYTLYPDLFPLDKAVDFNGDGEATAADAVFLLWHSLYPKEYPLG